MSDDRLTGTWIGRRRALGCSTSRHPDNDGNPVWSPDGNCFTGRETRRRPTSISSTRQEEAETTCATAASRGHRKIEKARGAGRSIPAAKRRIRKRAKKDDGKQSAAEGAGREKEETRSPAASQEKRLPVVRIDFDGIRMHPPRRISDAWRTLFWSTTRRSGLLPRSTARAPTRSRRRRTGLLLSSVGYDARGSPGQPDSLARRWGACSCPPTASWLLNFAAYQQVNLPARFQAAFELCWRTMRDFYYDGALNHRNWDEIRRKYTGAAREAADAEGLGEVVNLMLGELNGSHLGFLSKPPSDAAPKTGWSEVTPHFGLRFAPGYQGPGLKVRDVIGGSPADQVKSRILAGEIVMAIDGRPIDPAVDLAEVANGRLDRTCLTVRNARARSLGDACPITYAPLIALYESWIKQNREVVAKGPAEAGLPPHAPRDARGALIGQHETRRGSGQGRVVIDVRERGGSTTDHPLTALTQPAHAITVPRRHARYPQDRHVYATWSKPDRRPATRTASPMLRSSRTRSRPPAAESSCS